MSIQSTDLKFYKSSVVSDATNNGGRMSDNEVVSGVKNNLFPNVTHTERLSGKTRYRKEYLKNINSEGLTLQNTLVWIGRRTPAQDEIYIAPGTNTDTQADSDDYSNYRGAGLLNESVSAGVTNEFDVIFDTSNCIFNGDTIHIGDDTNEEFVVLDSTNGVSWSGNLATLRLASGTTVAHDFSATVTVVSGCIDLGSIVASSDNWAESNIHGGTYDEATYPILVYNEGTVEDSWTVTFTGSGTFSVAGTNTGSVGSGTTGSNFTPTHGSSYYFRIQSAGWAGTWTTGDSVTFDTHHSAKSIWVKEIVPVSTPSYSNNNPRVDVYGESS